MRRLDCGRRDISAEREQHIGLRANEVRGKIGETLRPALRITILNREVVALDVTEIAQGATGCFHLRVSLRGAKQQNAQARDLCGLLRARRERPRGHRAAEQRDEITSSQLIELHSVSCHPGPDCRISNWRGSVSGHRSDCTTG
jgi:hypothetical protein